MILVDANLLIHAYDRGARHHERARTWLAQRLGGRERVGLPWPSLLAYVRLTTNPRVFPRPLTVGAAWADVKSWLSCPSVWIPSPGEAHAEILGALLAAASAGGNLVPDAHLAALAIEHGVTLVSADRGFARFPGLRFADPLADL